MANCMQCNCLIMSRGEQVLPPAKLCESQLWDQYPEASSCHSWPIPWEKECPWKLTTFQEVNSPTLSQVDELSITEAGRSDYDPFHLPLNKPPAFLHSYFVLRENALGQKHIFPSVKHLQIRSDAC